MSAAEIFIDRSGPLLRAAVVEGGDLTDLHLDHENRPSLLGSIFLGRVERIVPGLEAAFIDLGAGRTGFLPASDVRPLGGRNTRIGSLLRGGQPVLVQVKTDAVGEKGPALTMDVTLPGRFLVHAPLGRGLAISKRIAQGGNGQSPGRAELAKRLAAVTVGEGWIARAGAVDATPERLEAEVEALVLQWRAVEQAAAGVSAPAQLAAGPDAARRAIVEQGGRRWSRIAVADPATADALLRWSREAAADLVPVIERAGPGLFDTAHDLDSQIARLTVPRVPLRGGGSLVIERTEALTVVDVNAGDRATPLAVNLAAAAEIARQLRLRNVGGIVVVDFVNMAGKGDAERVVQALSTAVADDPAQTHVYGMSRLGLVEITRARRGSALLDLLRPGEDATGGA